MKNLYKSSLLTCVSAIAFNATHVTTCSAMDKRNITPLALESARDQFGNNTFNFICNLAKNGYVHALRRAKKELECKCLNGEPSYVFILTNYIEGELGLSCKFRGNKNNDFTNVSIKNLWKTLEFISKKGNIATMIAFFAIVRKVFTIDSIPPWEVEDDYEEQLKRCFDIAKKEKNFVCESFLHNRLSEIKN